ncbi:MAG: hypothetical protein IKH05_01325 [Bacteroidaceae bacterium]|nr:hypothetical protein [Bacteroidaceae bacterium]
MTNEEVVKIASEKLESHADWRVAYKRYSDGISSHKELYKRTSSFLKRTLPRNLGSVRIYSSINLAQQPSVEYDLRIFGQSVGTLAVKDIGVNCYKLFLKITKKHECNNLKHLHIETKANPPRMPYEWGSEEAQNIFNSLISYKGEDAEMHSEEHKLETLVLSDLAKEHKENGVKGKKLLTYIRPVVLGGLGFFQMRTPFKASSHSDKNYPQYSMRKDGAASGGGIDILARVQHKNNKWRLAIIELKDENKKSESQPIVMQQALVYATFVAHLLRDKDCGNSWWNLFRNQDKDVLLDNQKDIAIDVVTMMPPIPRDKTGNLLYKECDMNSISVPNIPNVTLYPSTIYIDSNLLKNKLINVFGTLIDDKRES